MSLIDCRHAAGDKEVLDLLYNISSHHCPILLEETRRETIRAWGFFMMDEK